jgi:hypothetical protein
MLSKGASYLTTAVLANVVVVVVQVVHGAPAPLWSDRRAIEDPFAVLDPQKWANPDDSKHPKSPMSRLCLPVFRFNGILSDMG